MDPINVINIILLAGAIIYAFLSLGSRLKYQSKKVRLGGREREEKETLGKKKEPVELHPSQRDNADDPDVDIIAIHGLDTNSQDTWCWKERFGDKSIEENDAKKMEINWLTQLLPSVVKPARIFTCDWPSDLYESKEYDSHTFRELAVRLLRGIMAQRPGRAGDRPILFVASCLGGIILLQALQIANTDDEFRTIKIATRGIVFLATPFRGTAFQDVAGWAEPGLRTWASINDRRLTELVSLTKDSTFLGELRHDFFGLYHEHDYEIHTFYEKGYTDLLRKIPWLPRLFRIEKKQLVDKDSGTLDCDPHPTPFNRPHILMNKFRGDNKDTEYHMLEERIARILEKIRDGPLQKADKHLTAEHYNPEKLKIERISGAELPMDHCYINLAIIKQVGEIACGSEEKSENIKTPLSSSLRDRLKIKTPTEKLQVQLSTLYENKSEGKAPSRILIRGRAGVGKTTLCKKIISDFTRGKLWKGLFTRILWIPLRKLKDRQYQEYNYRSLFFHIYFEDHPKGKSLADSLSQAVTTGTASNHRSLFILDGLDEVADLLSRNHPASGFFTKLLSNPDIIVTTRPHGLPHDMFQFDLELETIGFYPDQVENYIEKVVEDLEEAERIRRFLLERPLLQNLARIPVQLDALCYAWGKHGAISNRPMDTMTSIYNDIINCLWRKDIVRLGKLPEDIAQNDDQEDINNRFEEENELLGCLAISGIYSKVIDFEKDHREKINRLQLRELRGSPTEQPTLNELLTKSSFLRTTDTSVNLPRRTHHFLHLTFQEFFAAHYFAQKWESGGTLKYEDFKKGQSRNVSPVEFLKLNKYNADFDIVWRFTVGLLKGKKVKDFFDTIEQEPYDILGPTHQRLVIHCLNEVKTLNDEVLSLLTSRFSMWLQMEFSFRGSTLLIEETEFPDDVFIKIWTGCSPHGKECIFRSLKRRGRFLSERVVKAYMEFIKNEQIDRSIRDDAVRALVEQANLSESAGQSFVYLIRGSPNFTGIEPLTESTEPATAAIIELYQHEDFKSRIHVVARYSAYRSFRQKDLKKATSDPIISDFIQILENKVGNTREMKDSAFGFLKRETHLCEEYVERLIKLIEDNDDYYTQIVASMIIENQTTFSRMTAETFLKWTKDENDTEISRIPQNAAALALQGRRKVLETDITILVELIDSDNTRGAVLKALKKRPNLFNEVIDRLLLIQNDYIDLSQQAAAVKTLGHISDLPERAVAALLGRIPSTIVEVQVLAAHAIANQASLPNEAIEYLEKLIRNEKAEVRNRASAAIALRKQTNLSETTITALISLFQNHANDFIYSDVADSLQKQSNLSEANITTIIAVLLDKSNNLYSPKYALKCLMNRPDLPRIAVEAIIGIYESEPIDTVRDAIKVLGNQTNLLWAAISRLLRSAQMQHIAEALGEHPILLDKMMRGVSEFQKSTGTAFSHSLIQSLYPSFLYRSFQEHFWLCIENDNLVINSTNESLTIALNDGGPSNLIDRQHFMKEALEGSRGVLRYPSFSLAKFDDED